MFQKYYFYYRLFWLNKLNNSRRTFLCWPIPPSTFAGSQLLQIKNRNYYWQLPSLFQPQPQKFCQHNLFHNGGNVRDYHPLPINKANSSSTIQSPKMPTNNAIQQIKQQQNSAGRETEKPVDNHGYLEKRFLQLDIYNKKQFGLALKKGRSGQKTFETKLYMPDKFVYFDNILVPQDAYSFVRALDELIGELTTENFEQKLHNIKAPQSIVGGRPQLKRELKLRNVLFTGREHQFQLELVLFINADNKGGKMEKRICLRLLAINKINMKKSLNLPLKALPWMRKQMAEMLRRHDGTQAITWEGPAQIPRQFFPKNETCNFRPTIQNGPSFGGKLEKKNSPTNMERGLLKELSAEILELKKEIRGLKREINDVFRAPPVPNGIYSTSRSMAQNGNRQQFVNQQYTKMANKIARNFNQSGYKKQKMMFTPLSVQQRRSNLKKLDPKIAALEGGIQTLFDFDDEDMENYRRIAAKIEHPSTEH